MASGGVFRQMENLICVVVFRFGTSKFLSFNPLHHLYFVLESSVLLRVFLQFFFLKEYLSALYQSENDRAIIGLHCLLHF